MKAPTHLPQPGATEAELIEALAELEHEQWQHWSQAIAASVPPPTRMRWEASWQPYASMTDDLKELDRIWARKVVRLLRHQLIV